MAWLPTGDLPSSALVSVRFLVPINDWCTQSVMGAFDFLTYASSWRESGLATPDQAAAVFQNAQQSVLIQNNNVGMIVSFACDKMEFLNRDPSGPQSQWYPCNGDFLSVVAFPDLYARIGNTWGGDSTVFAVPDLPGVTIIGVGTSSEGSTYALAERVGTEFVTLSESEMPSHVHVDSGHAHSYTGPILVGTVTPPPLDAASVNPIPGSTGSGAANIQPAGNDAPHENRQPSEALYWYIQVLP